VGRGRRRPGGRRGDRDRGELLGFYVHPAYWGTGAAQQLIERCHDGLAELGDEWLLWVLRENQRARAFYERNGCSPGSGDEVVHAEWAGPVMDGAPRLDAPLPEIQYRRTRRGGTAGALR
jgi:RimJ/RimL family protein N-acetyltransferase